MTRLLRSRSPRFLFVSGISLFACLALAACGGEGSAPDGGSHRRDASTLDAPDLEFPDAARVLDATSALDAAGPHEDAASAWEAGAPDAFSTSDAWAPRTCGGRGSPPCPEGWFCNFPIDAACGRADGTGTCAPIPEICSRILDPVCGCDGVTYNNACLAAHASVSIESEGPCPINCDPDDVVCGERPPLCRLNMVPSVVAGCWGPCVALNTCTCETTADCPSGRCNLRTHVCNGDLVPIDPPEI